MAVSCFGQTSSVLSSGQWFKVSVQNDAIYKIDYSFLQRAGFNPNQIDPRKIQLFGGMNGMLPQSNSAPRINDLSEISLYVVGESDGKFDQSDYILFYGQGPDGYQLLSNKGVFSYENNLFTDKNFYFLTIGSTPGKRMATTNTIAGTFPIVNELDDFGYYETEQFSILHSGRQWFGEFFSSTTEYTIRFDTPGILDASNLKLITKVMGQSYNPSSFQYFINNTSVGQQDIPPAINYEYADQGVIVADTINISLSQVNGTGRTNQDVKIRFNKAASQLSIGYLDYVLLQFKRKLSLYGDQTLFHSLKSLQQPVTQYSITDIPSGGMIFEITDPFNSKIQGMISGAPTTFSATSDILRKYIMVSGKNFTAPGEEGKVENQNLHGITNINFVIISAPEFLDDAGRLAAHRQSKGITTQVFTPQQVYNEFSGGKQDVTAIRDFMKNLYDRNTGIKNLLLFGRGSYDYKNYLPNNKNFVPIYQSRNSLSPLETYASDDYFGFLENNEGNWGESPVENHTLDISIGRLPVKKTGDSQIIVDKLIQYDGNNWGDWRKVILFAADDGDGNIHQDQADLMAKGIEVNHPEFNTKKIYIDDFKQKNSPIGKVSPDASNALARNAQDGVAIINYTGHGGETLLASERLLDQISLDKWKTGPRYPFLVTATCQFGRNDDPSLISTAELSLFKMSGGTIGLLTSARPVNSSTNFTLNKAFYDALFIKIQNQFRDIGAVFRDTKNNSISGVSNRNFSLLGDPTMRLVMPASEIRITGSTNMTSGSDTLKALSKVRISGTVYTNGSPDPGYNGTLHATLFDKLTEHITKGDENDPFKFTAYDNSVFRGQASIYNGQFDFEFIVPQSIDPAVSYGKFSLYAINATRDVTGVNNTLEVGAKEKNPGVDTKGPSIELYMGDSTFVNGGIAGTSSRIIAILSDVSGINISNFVPDKGITATLDDTLTLSLNNYYQSDVNNYKRGKVNYAIDNLKPGNHQLTLKATDTFGNSSFTSISFFVSDQNGIQIEQFLNYPRHVSS
ncbi:MAG TPA: type IX secretion system sortase PorU, partial [Cyclobacteriaceae bacterium]|nr:type IX secretion system sortase PorU [Cyclobacteriaceae bacterium]